MLSRRSFLINSFSSLGAAVSTASALSTSNIESTNDLHCNKLDISLEDLPINFDGLKIAFLTDPHIGDCSSAELLERAVALAQQENPDLVILGGDYINALDMGINRFFYHYRYADIQKSCQKEVPDFKVSVERGLEYFDTAAKIAKRLNPALGIIAILGNHDRWNSADNCCKIFKENGIDILVNQSKLITKGSEQIEIYGTDDYSTGIPKIPARNSNFRIIVSHNPDFLEEMGNNTNVSLGLAGHTHAGQISLPILGPIFSNIQYPQLIQGLNYTSGKLQVFTSAGIGTSGLPIRLNCPPEVSILNLHRG